MQTSKSLFWTTVVLVAVAFPVFAQSQSTGVSLTGEATVETDASSSGNASAQCWHDPYPSDAMNVQVSCTDPSCNVGPCTEKENSMSDPAEECWHNPTKEDPPSRAPNTRVSCDDPACNEGPCIGTEQTTLVQECWRNPTLETPGSFEQNTRVSCDDPACNQGPCVPTDSGVTHTSEWTSPNEGDPGMQSEEKGGTEDISIGVGELQETRSGYVKFGDIKGESDDSGSQAKKPKEIVVVGSKVREAVSAGVIVRGWDPEKKEPALDTDDVQSEDDLIDFSAGILAGEASIESIEISDSSIGMDSAQAVRLFGLFTLTMQQRVEISSDPDDKDRVKVRFPWWSLVAIPIVSAGEIKESVEIELAESIEAERENYKRDFGENEATPGRYQTLARLIISAYVDTSVSE